MFFFNCFSYCCRPFGRKRDIIASVLTFRLGISLKSSTCSFPWFPCGCGSSFVTRVKRFIFRSWGFGGCGSPVDFLFLPIFFCHRGNWFSKYSAAFQSYCMSTLGFYFGCSYFMPVFFSIPSRVNSVCAGEFWFWYPTRYLLDTTCPLLQDRFHLNRHILFLRLEGNSDFALKTFW